MTFSGEMCTMSMSLCHRLYIKIGYMMHLRFLSLYKSLCSRDCGWRRGLEFPPIDLSEPITSRAQLSIMT